ncbi:MAG: aldose epimerase family protein, partial [Fusobacterium sp.]
MISTDVKEWGITKKGEQVYCYTLKNEFLEVNILNYGGVIQKIMMPDKNGKFENIVLGFDDIKGYEERSPHFGAIVGRTAGRIKKGELYINGTLYQLKTNNCGNNLHGYPEFYGQKIWDCEILEEEERAVLILKRTSPHLEAGYPGKIDFTVKYILDKNSLILEYEGIPYRDTYMSLTNHTYFNLSGDYKKDIGNQKITLACDEYLEVDEETLPVKISKVDNSIFDLRKGRTFNDVFSSDEEQVKIVNGGIDHPFVLSHKENLDAVCIDEESGRILEMKTDQPAVVIYTGNWLDEVGVISGNVVCRNHFGFCLETQDYPDVLKFIPEKSKIYNENK